MRLVFPTPMLVELETLLEQNPTAIAVRLTPAEMLQLIEELLANNDGRTVTASSFKEMYFKGRSFKIMIVEKA